MLIRGTNAAGSRNVRERLDWIARCKQETGDIWHAHFGTAAIAAYFFAKENRLSDLSLRSLTDQCEAMIKKHLRTPAILKANGCAVRQAEAAIRLNSLSAFTTI
ncbi:hypothetical protein C8Z91_14425 [Paenibacillus elgii]|uniref:Uncharacterized protein n=1 Tax=Paenibacillus elgii TaxID=189691 RepID=A0A2T6G2K6_9BACL|nr:hypothetical protein [Paenibacillus elgii]PUA38379.1 hypothetical protein C8Z91_14425 [Paenibacillus elgii]